MTMALGRASVLFAMRTTGPARYAPKTLAWLLLVIPAPHVGEKLSNETKGSSNRHGCALQGAKLGKAALGAVSFCVTPGRGL